jgi:hypothetical protein
LPIEWDALDRKTRINGTEFDYQVSHKAYNVTNLDVLHWGIEGLLNRQKSCPSSSKKCVNRV